VGEHTTDFLILRHHLREFAPHCILRITGSGPRSSRTLKLEIQMRSRILVAFVLATSFVLVAQEQTVRKTTAPHTSAASGKEMFAAYCASCHGADGKGKGPAASALKTPPSDLTVIQKANGGKFPSDHVFEIINGRASTPAHGSADMPVWGPIFRRLSGSHDAEVQQRVSNLTDYIRSMQQK
jgi:mono/diheme cytochrome c family protein